MTNLKSLQRLRWSREMLVAPAVLLALLVLLVPLPPFVLDLLLTVSLGLGLAVLLVAMLADGPLGFPTLPGVLVGGSLLRVGLAVAVAHSVLARGAAGSLVQTLGGVLTAAGENLIGGIAALAVLMLAGYAVLNLGLTRLAEVAARFSLDAMPGRQMALDAALAHGHVEPEAGASQSARLRAENAFYGAMDGAARFLRGETLVVALIVVLVPLAGLAGSGAQALDWTELVALALGTGLVILVPGLLAMVAAALVLSRTDSGALTGGLETALLKPGLLVVIAAALLAVGIMPGVAKAPLLVGAAGVGALAWFRHRRPAPEADPASPPGEMQLRLGTNLLALTAGRDLAQALNRQRLALADELGFAVPGFVIGDDVMLPPHAFAVALNGTVILQATLRPGRRLAVPAAGSLLPPEGERVVLPDGRAATWVREPGEDEVVAEDIHLLEPLEAMGLYLRAALRSAAPELFNVQRAHELLAAVRVSHPAVVRAFEDAGLTVLELCQVGRGLLAEGLPLLERVSLLEALAEAGPAPAVRLIERVRPALRRTITRLVAPEGTLYALELCEEMRQELKMAVHRAGEEQPITLAPERADHWHGVLRRAQQQYAESTVGAVLLCPPELRRAAAQLAQETGATVAAVQAGELLPLTEIICIGVLPERDTGPVLTPAAGK